MSVNLNVIALASLEELAAMHGKEAVMAAAEQLLGKIETTRRTPAEYVPVLAPIKLDDTIRQLEASVEDLLEIGNKREAAYAEKGALLQEKTQLEARIQLTEAEAWMGTADDGKSVTYKGTKHATSNDTLRDAFKRFVTKDLREKLAEVEGKLARVEVGIIQARDAYEKAAHAADSIRSKAFVQARLLQFLAGGY